TDEVRELLRLVDRGAHHQADAGAVVSHHGCRELYRSRRGSQQAVRAERVHRSGARFTGDASLWQPFCGRRQEGESVVSKSGVRKRGLALGVVACSALFWSWSRRGGDTAQSAPVAPVALAPRSAPAAPAPLAEEQPIADARAPGGRSVDPAKVQEAL